MTKDKQSWWDNFRKKQEIIEPVEERKVIEKTETLVITKGIWKITRYFENNKLTNITLRRSTPYDTSYLQIFENEITPFLDFIMGEVGFEYYHPKVKDKDNPE